MKNKVELEQEYVDSYRKPKLLFKLIMIIGVIIGIIFLFTVIYSAVFAILDIFGQ